jgi:hypothetical protein
VNPGKTSELRDQEPPWRSLRHLVPRARRAAALAADRVARVKVTASPLSEPPFAAFSDALCLAALRSSIDLARPIPTPPSTDILARFRSSWLTWIRLLRSANDWGGKSTRTSPQANCARSGSGATALIAEAEWAGPPNIPAQEGARDIVPRQSDAAAILQRITALVPASFTSSASLRISMARSRQ